MKVFKSIGEINEAACTLPAIRLAIAAAADEEVLKAVKMAEKDGIIEPVLIGNEKKITQALREVDYHTRGRVIGVESPEEAADKSMELIKEGQADLAMKGLLSTRTILKAFLAEEYGFRQGSLLSLVTLLYLDKEKRNIIISDSGINIAPGLEEKMEIIKNAVEIAGLIGIKNPKVAVLSAVEKVNPAMKSTVEAALLAKMSERGQFKKAIVEGPLALDNALSAEAAERKGIDGSVAGQADILITPDIEAGNILYKALVYYNQLPSASLVSGARIPLVLTSRVDSARTKYNSIALARIVLKKLAP